MKAVVWTGDQSFQLSEVPEPEAKSNQVVVKVGAAAICGTDFHYADFRSKPPIIPGHEVAGTVVDVGREVTGLSVGDQVALDPVQRCSSCYACTHGIKHLCLNVRHLGGERAAGGWAEYLAIDAVNAYRIPDGLPLTAAALAEPSAVCYQSLRRCSFEAGQSVLVIGDGPFGLLHAAIAKILGAREIIVSGHYDERLSRIAAYTGAEVCNARQRDLQEIVMAKTDGTGVDVVIDASGAGAAPNIGIASLRPRGTLVIFSYIWHPEPPDFGTVSMKELNVIGSCRSHGCFESCLQWMVTNEIPAKEIVDLQVPLEQVEEAMHDVQHKKQVVFKAVLVPARD